MKYVLVVLLFVSVHSVFGQAFQYEIPDYAIDGKDAKELRLMRNEIYARYGLIFKSDDLKDHFSQMKWYDARYENVDDLLTELDKKNIALLQKEERNPRVLNYELKLENVTTSSIKRFYYSEYDSYITRTTTVDYYSTFHMGTIKTVREAVNFEGEGDPTVLFAETIDPDKLYWNTTKYCHDITFFPYYYQTVDYGCCAAENYHEFYNYNSETPFLIANEKYFLVDVPNGGIELFIGYNHSVSSRETLAVAELQIATLDGLINKIKFKANTLKDYEDIEAFYSPKVELISPHKENRMYLDNRMTLWSKNFEKNIENVDGFSVRITFEGTVSGRKAVYEFPIEKGKLVGKSIYTIALK